MKRNYGALNFFLNQQQTKADPQVAEFKALNDLVNVKLPAALHKSA